MLSYQTYRKIDGNGLIQGVMFFDIAKRIYVSPTAKVTDGDFEFSSRWQMVAPQLRAKVAGTSLSFSPYYVNASPAFSDKGARLTAVDSQAGHERRASRRQRTRQAGRRPLGLLRRPGARAGRGGRRGQGTDAGRGGRLLPLDAVEPDR